MIRDHTTNVPFFPKLFRRICRKDVIKTLIEEFAHPTVAIGCPMGLFKIEFTFVPMLNTIARFNAVRISVFYNCRLHLSLLPQPSTHPLTVFEITDQGTAIFAFRASSLIWTLESKPPRVKSENCSHQYTMP